MKDALHFLGYFSWWKRSRSSQDYREICPAWKVFRDMVDDEEFNSSSPHLAPLPMISRAFSSPLHLLPLERGEALCLSGKDEHFCYRPSTHPHYSVSYSKCLSSDQQGRSFEGRGSPTLREDVEVICKWRRETCFPIMCPTKVLSEPNLAIRWPITSAMSPLGNLFWTAWSSP